MRKLTLSICDNNGTNKLALSLQSYLHRECILCLKLEGFSQSLWLVRPVCVELGRKF